MSEKGIEVKDKSKRSKHVEISFGLLYTRLLSSEEKLCFIALRSFLEFGKDSGEVWPTMDTVCQITGMSRSRATRAIASLVKKRIVTKKRRGLNKPNLYYISDNPYIWESGTEEELRERAEHAIPHSTKEMIDDIVKRGRTHELMDELVKQGIIKKEELTSDTDQSTDESPPELTIPQAKNTKTRKKNQVQGKKSNSFNSFEQRTYGDDLEASLRKAQLEENKKGTDF